MIVKDSKFWIGFIAGIVVYLVYMKFATKKMGPA